MAINLTTLKALVREEAGQPSTTEISDTTLLAAITSGIRAICLKLSIMHGVVRQLVTVADQNEYTLAADVLDVDNLFSGPARTTSEVVQSRERFDFAAIEIGERLYEERVADLDELEYDWEFMGGTLYLGVTPTESGQIIKYECKVAGSALAGVPDTREEALKEYAKAVILRIRAAYLGSHEAMSREGEMVATQASAFVRQAEVAQARYKELMRL